jgi:hypothetical protein
MRASTTDQPSYYETTSEQLARELPGELVLTPWQLLVVKKVTAYQGLARKDMQDAFDKLSRPLEGRWCVTPIRSGSNLNVTGTDAAGNPQLASLALAFASDPEKDVTLPMLARGIADARGDALPSGKEVRDYLTMLLHDQLVFDPKSPMRFIPNPADPLPGRRARVKFTVAKAEELIKFRNRIGVGVYNPNGIQPMDRQGTWELLLDQIAKAVGVQDRFALASNISKFDEALRKFPLLQTFLEDDEG